MFEASQARKYAKNNTRKRPASSEPKPPIKKRPAAAKDAAKEAHTKITTFSKAALNLERKIDMTGIMKDVQTKLEGLENTAANRNKVTSKAYAAGVRMALNLKAKDEIAKEFGRMQLSKASSAWLKYHCG